MAKTPFQPGNTLNAICFLASAATLLWLMRSGALVIWDRYSPGKEGPIVPWVIALPVAIVGGILLMAVLTIQISLLVDWWRDRRDL